MPMWGNLTAVVDKDTQLVKEWIHKGMHLLDIYHLFGSEINRLKLLSHILIDFYNMTSSSNPLTSNDMARHLLLT